MKWRKKDKLEERPGGEGVIDEECGRIYSWSDGRCSKGRSQR